MSEFLANRFNYGFFEGEALWIGNLGHFFIVLSFVMLALASFSFFKAEITKDNALQKIWNKIARNAFYIHGFSILGIFSLLFYMILTHHYEYHYAWSHSSNDLPVYYIISSYLGLVAPSRQLRKGVTVTTGIFRAALGFARVW